VEGLRIKEAGHVWKAKIQENYVGRFVFDLLQCVLQQFFLLSSVVRYLSRTSRIVVMLNGLSGSSDLAYYVEAMRLAEL